MKDLFLFKNYNDYLYTSMYFSRCVSNIFLNLYKLPCLWVAKFIFVLLCTVCCKYARITLITLSYHPFGLTFGGFAFIGSLAWTLNNFIALPINVSWGSITIADGVLYLTNHSYVLGILDIIYCISF